MTDQQQPPPEIPERIWLSRHWANYTEHSCQFSYEQKHKDDIEFVARIHSVDDARVEALKPDIKDWLTEECGRLKNGQCMTRCCLVRGGYTGAGAVDYDAATCEAYEVSQALLPQLSSSELSKEGRIEKEFTIEDAAKVVYRTYGANLSAFWRDAFAAEAQKHGRDEVDQYGVDGNCIHCIPICRKCQLNTIEAHLREKEQVWSNAPVSSSERRCDLCGHEERYFSKMQRQCVYVVRVDTFEQCGCKCVFPATAALTNERRERYSRMVFDNCYCEGDAHKETCSLYVATTGAGEGEQRPKVICLCGSTRFVQTWIDEYQRLSDEGNIVLTVARMPPRPNLQHDEPELKARLDALHLRKIDLADEVFVLDVDGYIGSSTKREIEYAVANNKPVWYLSGTVSPVPVAKGEPRLCGICIAAGRVYCPPEHWPAPTTAPGVEAAQAFRGGEALDDPAMQAEFSDGDGSWDIPRMADTIVELRKAGTITPSEGAGDEDNAERLARVIYDTLAENDDINRWHKDAILPMLTRVIREHFPPPAATPPAGEDAE